MSQPKGRILISIVKANGAIPSQDVASPIISSVIAMKRRLATVLASLLDADFVGTTWAVMYAQDLVKMLMV